MAPVLPDRDAGLSWEQRINDLLGRLTPPEKFRPMLHDSPAIDRVGAPACEGWNLTFGQVQWRHVRGRPARRSGSTFRGVETLGPTPRGRRSSLL